MRNEVEQSPFRPKTEEELLERIDQSMAQADNGQLLDAEGVATGLIAEFAA